jgi:heat shock protein HslJ
MTQDNSQPESSQQQAASSGSSNKGLAIAVVVALVVIIGLLAFLLVGQNGGGDAGSGEGGDGGAMGPGVVVPTPRPDSPSFTVIAPDGANIRVGPGTDYASLGAMTKGTSGQVVGISEDSKWIVIHVPQGPNGQGWVSAGLVEVTNAGSVPVLPPPGQASTPAPSPDESATLAGTNWQLDSFSGSQAPLPETAITLSFDVEGNANGSAGCNNYNTVYTANQGQLAFGPISSTQKLCDEAINAQEALYIFALEETESYMLDGSQLILYDASGTEQLRYNRIG